ncbi:protein translocase subunit SecD [Ornithinicoccus hortensis]|uniref:Protein translocase subunit SecD n=1 Tax=Ornithinicoccus hortensis TaxID=82346 RepID=A0A542YT87_9MICO|nr:protein translocase subunit SecD [Ornithinicoccus hortensis]TQL51309.1 preprotein translocase subunit SecD [Ornithinicoccus hortensis]
MAKKTKSGRNRTSIRTIIALGFIIALVFGGVGAAKLWSNPPGQLTPLLGLDLAGGRQIVLEPVVEGDADISAETVDQAIDIIRRRIDGNGVAEAEVSRLGATSISVAIPGNPTQDQLDALSRSSQLQFRAVLVAQATQPMETTPPTPTRELPMPTGSTDDPAATGDEATDDATGGEPSVSVPEGSGEDGATVTDGAYPEGLLAAGDAADEATATDAPGATGADDEQTTDDAVSTEGPEDTDLPTPTDASDLAWVTPELQQEFMDLDCSDPEAAYDATSENPAVATVACSSGGLEKFILGPSEVTGASVTDASSGLEMGQAGPTGRVQVSLTFDAEGTEAFREITARLAAISKQDARNRFAIVLDREVISAPGVNEAIPNGTASIAGGFTNESAELLANQLKFGALPMSFTIQTSEQISPTLGGEQLRLGIIAGIIGLVLVFIYSLLQYRALGLVTVGSLLVATALTYGTITLLGTTHNFRLTMAGVTGVIVAIGVTADSFIVYFERIRDEVRAGRPLRYAVDTGWRRARGTIIISDAVNLIAASVLYFLSEAGVKAFAFTLGLTTVIDLLVVIMFTHPVVSILANTEFFGQGHKWSGMDPERLGAKRSTYLGRGRFSAPEPKKPRHTREELEGGIV